MKGIKSHFPVTKAGSTPLQQRSLKIVETASRVNEAFALQKLAHISAKRKATDTIAPPNSKKQEIELDIIQPLADTVDVESTPRNTVDLLLQPTIVETCLRVSDITVPIDNFLNIKPLVKQTTTEEHEPKSLVKANTPLIASFPIVLSSPAYLKYAHLTNSIDRLPKEFVVLEKMFSSLDTVVNFMAGRREPSIYHKIKKSVENLCDKSFDLFHLAQIMAVYPAAYNISPIRTIVNRARIESILIVTPTPEFQNVHEEAMFSSRNSVLRKRLFKEGLLDLVFQAHQQFISTLGFDIARKSRSELREFHSKFKLDEHVPSIQPASLPSCEALPVKPSLEERDPLPVKIAVLAHVIEKVAAPPAAQISRYEALKLRILQKEKKIVEDAMFKSVKTNSQLHTAALASRFPEMVRCIAYQFTGQKKQGIVIGQVAQTLINSHKTGLNNDDAYSCIRMMAEIAPQWLTVIRLSDGRDIVKMDRNTDMKKVMSQMKSRLEEFK